MRTKIFSWVKLGCKFSFSFLILFFMVKSGRLNLDDVRRGFSHGPALFGSITLVILGLFLSIYRWGLLMRGQGIEFSPAQLLRYGMIGCFFNTTMPGAVSGDLIKAWYVLADHKNQKKTPVLTSIVLDRIMGVFGLIIVSASPLLLFGGSVWAIPELRKVAFPVLALFCGVICFFAYVFLSFWGPLAGLRSWMNRFNSSRIGKVFLQAYDAWVSYRNRPLLLVVSLLLSVGTHLCIVTVVYLCAHAVGEEHLSIFHYFLLVPLGLLTTAIPVAPAGLGVGHVAFGALFSMGGSNRGAEVFTMLVSLQILLNISGVFFYLRSPKVKPGGTPSQASVQ